MRVWTTPILIVVLAVCGVARAQSSSEDRGRQTGLELRSQPQMTTADVELVTRRTPDIARAAEIYGYTLDGSYTYQQTLCPIAPNHLLLNYSKHDLDDSVSSFSAVIPRQGGTIEIFPIFRMGMMPYAQPWGEHSYNVFNSLVRQERQGMKRLDPNSAFSVPWKDLALCYVALVTTPQKNSQAPFQLASEVTVSIHGKGQPDVGFTASDSPVSYSNWMLQFTPRGVLFRAVRDQHSVIFTPDSGTDPSLPTPKAIPDATAPPASTH